MNKLRSNKPLILVLILPALIFFCVALPLPIIDSIRYSFYDWNLVGEMKFVGLGNYIKLFTHDLIFFEAFINTFLYTLGSMVLQLPFAMLLAVLLSKPLRGKKFFRNVFFLPVTISGTAVALLWQLIYHPRLGILNGLLSLFTSDFSNKVWLADSNFALWAVVIAVSWQWIGYHTLLYITGISTIPEDINEAAMIDGAVGWRLFRYITLPMLKPILKVSAVLIVAGSIKAFDSVYVLTSGGPAHSSTVLALHMYNSAFQQMRYGYGSAISTILLVLCIVMTWIVTVIFKSNQDQT